MSVAAHLAAEAGEIGAGLEEPVAARAAEQILIRGICGAAPETVEAGT